VQPDCQAKCDRPKNRSDFIKGETHRCHCHAEDQHSPARVSGGNLQQRPADQGRIGHAKDHRHMFVARQSQGCLGAKSVKKGPDPARPVIPG